MIACRLDSLKFGMKTNYIRFFYYYPKKTKAIA